MLKTLWSFLVLVLMLAIYVACLELIRYNVKSDLSRWLTISFSKHLHFEYLKSVELVFRMTGFSCFDPVWSNDRSRTDFCSIFFFLLAFSQLISAFHVLIMRRKVHTYSQLANRRGYVYFHRNFSDPPGAY